MQNRTLFVTFLTLLMYMLLVVGGTTDMILLLSNSKITMPFLNVEIPLLAFYTLAPLILLVFHFNLVFNLVRHQKKLSRWYQLSANKHETLLLPFLFNFPIALKGLNVYFLRLIFWGVLYLSPLLTLLFTQIRFSTYQNETITFFHFVITSLDVLMLSIYWHHAVPQANRNMDKLRPLTKAAKWTTHLLFLGIAISNLWGTYRVASGTKIDFPAWFSEDTIFPEFFKWADSIFVPHLDLREQKLVQALPSDVIVYDYLKRGKTKEEAWVEFAEITRLNNRSLNYADFSNANLIRVDFRNAQLQGANFSQAHLHGANLERAYLQNANFQEAQLQGISLWLAHAQGTNFSNAQMQGAYLGGARLEGANFDSAQLQGSTFFNSHLVGSRMKRAQLQGSNLRYAHLQGVDLRSANLQGADLSFSYLSGTNFKSTKGLNALILNDPDWNTAAEWQPLLEDNPNPTYRKQMLSAMEKSKKVKKYKIVSTPEAALSAKKSLVCNGNQFVSDSILQHSFHQSPLRAYVKEC